MTDPAHRDERADGRDRDRRGSYADRGVVLFDFDGTLVDTEPCILRACETVLSAHGLSREEMGDLRRFIGPPLRDCFRDCYGLTEREAAVYADEYRAVFDTFSPSDYPVFPGVSELLRDLSSQGRRLAVATSRLEVRARVMASELGIEYFDAIVGMNEPIRHGKADSVRDALAALSADPGDAVMVGDRHHDVEGARAHGLPCIGVCYSGTPHEELERVGADLVCDSIGELRVALGIPATQ